jgi:hypothetical protein
MTRPGAGKFEGNESLEVSEYLYETTMNGLVDDEIGDVESFGWHALVTGIDDDLDLLDVITGNIPDNLVDLKPAYIVSEDNNGFFTYGEFESSDEARAEWKDITQEYLALMSDNGEVSVL